MPPLSCVKLKPKSAPHVVVKSPSITTALVPLMHTPSGGATVAKTSGGVAVERLASTMVENAPWVPALFRTPAAHPLECCGERGTTSTLAASAPGVVSEAALSSTSARGVR